jgi:hypothetical protein
MEVRKKPMSSEARSAAFPYETVGSPVSCILTRFGLRSGFWLPFFFLVFRRVHKEARAKVPGLIRAVFLVESPTVCYTLSIWSDDTSIVTFGTHVASHVHAANWSFGRLIRMASGEVELFSAQFGLRATSNNMNWEGDLRSVVRNVD